MNLNIKTTKNILEIADFISASINKELMLGKNVLFFISGGSAIPLEVEISKKIIKSNSENLVVTLADERFGQIDHLDSNWFNLKKSGFNLEGATLIPFIKGKDFLTTVRDVKKTLAEAINKADYKIGIFGLGIDGHTAGILPHSEGVASKELVCAYNTELFERITITAKTILMLDEAIIYAVGEIKWPILENLKNEISIDEMPAQILKQVPLLTIFTDYKI